MDLDTPIINSDMLRKGRLSPEDEATLSKLLSQMTISSPGLLGLGPLAK